MYVRSQESVKSILEGQMEFNELSNTLNEMIKTWLYKDQAHMNRLLSSHSPICRALKCECRKDDCVFFQKNIADFEDGWICKEFQVNYPSASFDSRVHVTFIGEDTIDLQKTKDHLKYLMLEGARFICTDCKCVYQNIPQSINGNYQSEKSTFINLCDCGSEVFEPLDHFINQNFSSF